MNYSENTLQFHREPIGRGHFLCVNRSFTYGTDAVLLADFAATEQPRAERVADFGTGCGIIAFLWQVAENCRYSHTDAVEIQPEGCALARRTVEENGWQNSVSVHCCDIRALKGTLDGNAYDLIACNPPYGRSGGTLLNPTEERRIARHEQLGSFEEIALAAARTLRFGGKFCVCQRPERLSTVMNGMRAAGIEPKTLRLVQYRDGKAPNLFLLCGRKGGKDGMTVLPTLLLTDASGAFSADYVRIRERFAPDGFSLPAQNG